MPHDVFGQDVWAWMAPWIDSWLRGWEQFFARTNGPFWLRLFVQPLVATALGLRAGWRDFRAGRPAFFGWLLKDRAQRRALLEDAWGDVTGSFVAALCIDVVYQAFASHWFYPLQALLVAAVLALVPYVLVRGPAARVLRWLHVRTPPGRDLSNSDPRSARSRRDLAA